MNKLRLFFVRCIHGVWTACKGLWSFLESISVKQWVAFASVVIPLTALYIQMFQLNIDLEGQLHESKMQQMKDNISDMDFKIAITRELAGNKARSVMATAQFNNGQSIDPMPLYISDMYKAGITNGKMFTLPDKLMEPLFKFYETLPEYENLVETTQNDIAAVKEDAATCVEDGMDCDIYREHIDGLQKIQTKALIETIKKQDAFLTEAIANLRS